MPEGLGRERKGVHPHECRVPAASEPTAALGETRLLGTSSREPHPEDVQQLRRMRARSSAWGTAVPKRDAAAQANEGGVGSQPQVVREAQGIGVHADVPAHDPSAPAEQAQAQDASLRTWPSGCPSDKATPFACICSDPGSLRLDLPFCRAFEHPSQTNSWHPCRSVVALRMMSFLPRWTPETDAAESSSSEDAAASPRTPVHYFSEGEFMAFVRDRWQDLLVMYAKADLAHQGLTPKQGASRRAPGRLASPRYALGCRLGLHKCAH